MPTSATRRWARNRFCSCICLAALALASACGPPTRTVGGQGSSSKPVPRPELEIEQPVLRYVPSSAELVLVAPTLEKLVATALALEPFAQQDPMAKEWLARLSANLGSLPTLANSNSFGVDARAALALFSEGASSTLLVPVMAESQAWQGLAEAVFATQSQLLVDERGSVLALRWSADPASSELEPWVGAMQAASVGDSYAAGEHAKLAAEFARQFAAKASDEVWGSLNLPALLAHLPMPCKSLATGITGVSVNAKVLGGEGQLHMQVSLQDSTAAAMRGLLGPSASSGMLGLREQEGLAASMRLDMSAVAQALRTQQCPEIADIISATLAGVGFAPTAAHMAGSRFDPSEFSGQFALHLGLRDKSFFKSLLGQIPGRSLFESKVTMAGQKVVKVSVPLMSTLYYQLSDERLVFATHKGMMAELLTEPAEGQELVFVKVVPERLPQLTQLLSLALPRAEAQLVAAFLRQFAWLQATLSLKDTRLLFDLELRVQGT